MIKYHAIFGPLARITSPRTGSTQTAAEISRQSSNFSSSTDLRTRGDSTNMQQNELTRFIDISLELDMPLMLWGDSTGSNSEFVRRVVEGRGYVCHVIRIDGLSAHRCRSGRRAIYRSEQSGPVGRVRQSGPTRIPTSCISLSSRNWPKPIWICRSAPAVCWIITSTGSTFLRAKQGSSPLTIAGAARQPAPWTRDC